MYKVKRTFQIIGGLTEKETECTTYVKRFRYWEEAYRYAIDITANFVSDILERMERQQTTNVTVEVKTDKNVITLSEIDKEDADNKKKYTIVRRFKIIEES